VERSGDQSSWTKVGSVKAKGYSSTTTNYTFTDQLPLDGNDYYRLKMVDLDGKYVYSRTVSVTTLTDSRPLVVYSNPFSDMIRLKVNVSRAQDLTMTVSDMLGKTYVKQVYHAQSGDNLVNLTSSITSQGMYILRIHGDSYDQTVKLEKQ
jgi:Secretion system C-terminal sorting domain